MAAPTVPEGRPLDAQSAGGRLYLVVLGQDFTATQQLPEKGALLVGREETAEIRVLDPLASRQHARLHVGEAVEVEDLGSANGTCVREQRLGSGERAVLAPGECFTIGSTILMLRAREPQASARRVWPHGYFETRLIEECARAGRWGSTFALLRVHVEPGVGARVAQDVIAAALRPGDLLAVYGPNEYEALLLDSARPNAQALAQRVLELLKASKIDARGAVAFFPEEGVSPQELLSRANALVRGGATPAAAGDVVIANPAMRELYELAERAAQGAINVLVLGETGVGKEILAQTVHKRSPRAAKPFVCINCAALAETLLESELFGHEKGAFTGAAQSKTGLLESASGGTVFLDEIGEMSLPLQAKLLRVIETKQITRLGSVAPRTIDVRFVAATNRDLDEEVAQKRFRQDLYFRLNGVSLLIPPLRERPDEIELLARKFLQDVARQCSRPVPEISPEALSVLRSWTWPGNIRELRNVMERALLLLDGPVVTPEQLPFERQRSSIDQAIAGNAGAAPGEGSGPVPWPKGAVEDERQAILEALGRCAGNQTRAAELLGISRRTLCARIKEYDIARPRS